MFDGLVLKKTKLIDKLRLMFVKMEKVTDYEGDFSCTTYYKRMNGKIYLIKQVINRR